METSLNELLNELSSLNVTDTNIEEVKKWCDRLTLYYEKNMRHSYAEITEYILNNSGGIDYSYVILSNLEQIYQKDLLSTTVQQNLQKMIDHIKLEQVRYTYLSRQIEESAQEKFVELNNSKEDAFLVMLNDANLKFNKALEESEQKLESYYDQQTTEITSKAKSLRQGVDALQSLSTEVEEKLKNAQAENTAILGIFASIVLTFTGGMMFSSSIMENLNNTSFYRLILVCLILGGVLLNLISALLIYINRIIHYKHEFQNFFKENAFWIVINTLLVIGIIFTLILWKFSNEKKVNDAHNAYTIKTYENSLKDITEPETETQTE